MDNMMRSLSQLLIDGATAKLGIPAGNVRLILYPQESGEDEPEGDDHRRTITIRPLRTSPAPEEEACSNACADWPGEVEWFLTVFEILVTCRPSADNQGSDYLPNEARLLSEKVRAFFRGRGGSGLVVTRRAYDKAGSPAEGDGVVLFQRTDPQPQIPEDPTHTMVMTFEMTWWAPTPASS